MSRKPTYEELEQRVKELEKGAAESKRTEEELQESKSFLSNIFSSIQDGISILDSEYNIIRVNHAMEEWYSHKVPLTGKKCYEAYREQDKPCKGCPVKKTLATGQAAYEVVPKEGPGGVTIGWLDLYSFPIFDTATGQLKGVIEYVRDITERKMAEEALRASEERFRLTLDATTDGIWDYSLITGKSYYDRNWAKVLGYTAEDMNNPLLSWKRLLHPEDKERALAAADDNMSGRNKQYNVEFRLRNKAGEWQWILSRGKVVEWDENGNPLRAVGTHKDISDRKQFEEVLKKNSEKIKLFAYSVAHDLKSPAIATLGLTKLLHKHYSNILDEKGKNFCDQILKSSEQIAALVETINLYISTRETPINIEGIRLKEILRMTRQEFSAQLSSRQIKWSEPEHLHEINADRLSILRVLRNFVDNALKYGGAELSEIEIRYEESDKFHILSVRDDGVGLKQEESKGIFKMFKRKDNSIGIEGTGLGLAIVKEIAEQHKGDVWIKHGRRKGITFSISISKYL